MKALLIVAHGSRRKESNEEVLRLATRIKKNAGSAFDEVKSAFLEIADPQIAIAMKELVDSGVTEVKIFPYFLAAGTHVVVDIPAQVDIEQKKYPQLHLETLPHLGGLNGLSGLILNQVYHGHPLNRDLAALATD